MYRLRIIYVCVLLVAINNILGQSDIACVSDTPGDSDDTCPENSRCLLRQGINVTDYVCDCAGLYYTGYNCSVRTFITSAVTSCYGSNCSTGSFESENYPNKYSERRSAKIFLVYVPGILRFDLSFDNIFEVEMYKDDLYIGSGLNTPFYIAQGEIEENDNSDGTSHFFHGFSRPNDFSVTSDTMYMYWSTDNSLAYDGFRVNWISTAMDVTCPRIPYRIFVPDNSDRMPAMWPIPRVDCGVGYDNLIVTSNYHLGDVLEIGTYMINYDYQDIFGHSDFCSFELRVEVDTTPPDIIQCVENIQRTLELGTPGTTVSWIEPIATDISGVATLTSRSSTPGDNFTAEQTTITYIFTDSSGNSATCYFSVEIIYVDRTPPMCVDVPASINEVVELGTPNTLLFWNEPTCIDVSGTATITMQSKTSPSVFDIGTTVVTYTCTDASGNSGMCSFPVTVTADDTTPPMCVNVPENVSEIIELGSSGALVSWFELTCSDVSETAVVTARTQTPGSFFPVGITEVTYTCTDASGNSELCTFTVTIVTVSAMGSNVLLIIAVVSISMITITVGLLVIIIYFCTRMKGNRSNQEDTMELEVSSPEF